MGGAGTADAFEGHDIISVESKGRASFRNADCQSPSGHSESLPAKFEHFRHERQVIHRSRCVQCLKDFVRGLHFYEIAMAKSRGLLTHVNPENLSLTGVEKVDGS
jgi:hypothetical protein